MGGEKGCVEQKRGGECRGMGGVKVVRTHQGNRDKPNNMKYGKKGTEKRGNIALCTLKTKKLSENSKKNKWGDKGGLKQGGGNKKALGGKKRGKGTRSKKSYNIWKKEFLHAGKVCKGAHGNKKNWGRKILREPALRCLTEEKPPIRFFHTTWGYDPCNYLVGKSKEKGLE